MASYPIGSTTSTLSPRPRFTTTPKPVVLSTGEKWIIGIGTVVSAVLLGVILYSVYLLLKKRGHFPGGSISGRSSSSSSSTRRRNLLHQKEDQIDGAEYYKTQTVKGKRVHYQNITLGLLKSENSAGSSAPSNLYPTVIAGGGTGGTGNPTANQVPPNDGTITVGRSAEPGNYQTITPVAVAAGAEPGTYAALDGTATPNNPGTPIT